MDTINVQRKEIEKIYGKVSPFELKDKLIELAECGRKKSTHTLLNAGRGNPNWTASTPREAFFTFGLFAVSETKRTWNVNDLAGMPGKTGIADRLRVFIKESRTLPGTELVEKILEYGISELELEPDVWVYELADGIIGDNYPIPDRMLMNVERAVKNYLSTELYKNNQGSDSFDLFAVEGATAAMCYIFDSLKANELLSPGDRIAVMTPIFTPYLEVPHLPRYNFKVLDINANEITRDGTHTWQYPDSELFKLKDPQVKALFVVNPSNPPSVAMRPESLELLSDIVDKYNKNLMIISDDVYGTFTEGFRSIASVLPRNTISVYSFSKYFGVTGWRLGTIALNKDNIFDRLIRSMPDGKTALLKKRYAALSPNPEEISFIDRIVADSRQVALKHTAGLSTPQQVQMAFFAVFDMFDKDKAYKKLTLDICHKRQKILFESLGLELRKDPYDAAYYTEFDLLEWALHNYGTEFSKYLQTNYKLVDILLKLAGESSIVLLNGGGFRGPEWSVRISLANLNDEAYSEIGKHLHKVLEDYVSEWNNLLVHS
ncbi:MAG: aspartate 4-decarboxylase [Bacillota bacterium]|nr:aspartate 4-decarboxylase [Bacillota bacterium]